VSALAEIALTAAVLGIPVALACSPRVADLTTRALQRIDRRL
jgi:hypothetical protein